MDGIQLDLSAVVEGGQLVEEEAVQIEGGETFYIYGVFLTGVVFCGLIVNTLCWVRIGRKSLAQSKTYCNLLRWQSLVQSSVLISCFLNSSLPELSSTYKSQYCPLAVPFLLPVVHIFLTVSVYGLVAVAVEQYLVRTQHRWRSQGALMGYILPSLLLASCYNLPKFLLYTTVHTSGGPLVVPSTWRESREHVYMFIISIVIDELLPALLLASLSFCSLANSVKTRQHFKHPFLLALASGMVILANLPRHCLDAYEVYQVVSGLPPHLPSQWPLHLSTLSLALGAALTPLTLLSQVREQEPNIPGRIHRSETVREEDLKEKLIQQISGDLFLF